MSRSQFFGSPAGMTIGEIVALTAAQPGEGADLAQRIVNVAPLDTAGPGDLSYVESGKYLERLKVTRASACLMAERFAAAAPKGVVVLHSREPHRDFTLVAREMYAQALRPAPLFGEAGVAKTAIIHPSARIADGATVDPGAVIGPYAEIGPDARVQNGARVPRETTVEEGAEFRATSDDLRRLGLAA